MEKTNYLIPKNHPDLEGLMKKYKNFFQAIEDTSGKKIVLDIQPAIIKIKSNSMWGEIISVAEHSAKWIQLLMFAIEFNFYKDESATTIYKNGEWQAEKEISLWLRRLGEGIPFSFLFLKQWDARLHTIIGDMINQPSKIEKIVAEDYATYEFNKEQQNIIDSRIGIGCQLFMHYCSGTDYDPKPVIEAILAEFQIPYGYDVILKEFQKDIRENAQYRVSINGKKPKF